MPLSEALDPGAHDPLLFDTLLTGILLLARIDKMLLKSTAMPAVPCARREGGGGAAGEGEAL